MNGYMPVHILTAKQRKSCERIFFIFLIFFFRPYCCCFCLLILFVFAKYEKMVLLPGYFSTLSTRIRFKCYDSFKKKKKIKRYEGDRENL